MKYNVIALYHGIKKPIILKNVTLDEFHIEYGNISNDLKFLLVKEIYEVNYGK